MFGYVRPNVPELKVKEYERFKACYCGMCTALRREYGLAARFIHNYDFTFLAMVVSEKTQYGGLEYKRCIAGPLKKKCCYCCDTAFSEAACLCVILTWYKLRDNVGDDGLLKRIGARAAMFMLKKAYKKAAYTNQAFDHACESRLSELEKLEKEKCPSIDACADKFAGILAAVAETKADSAAYRPLRELLYHLGRWIYIADAADDVKQDYMRGSFNPIAVRYGISDGVITSEIAQEISLTLQNSSGAVSSSYMLMNRTIWSEIIENVIYLGLPAISSAILNGTWKKKEDRRPK